MKSSSFQLPSTASMLLIIASVAILFGIASSPLLGTPGPESAILIGAILGPLAFIAGASRGAERSDKGFSLDFIYEGSWVLIGFLVFVVFTWLNSFRLESCSEDRGLFSFVILTLPVLLINLATGVWLGRVIGRIGVAVAASIVLLLAYLVAQILWWWSFPSLRFFNHYWIVVTGDLIEGQALTPGIIGFRIATLLLALGLICLGTMTFKSVQKRRASHSSGSSLGLFFSALLLFGAALIAHVLASEALAPSRASMNAEYNLSLGRGVLTLHADPAVITNADAEAILAEGNLWLERLAERSGIIAREPIHLWLHSSKEKLAYFTGAENVHFTLPTHREIHISGTDLPHPTLGHELAHVLIGQISDTLFGVPGVLGVVPNQGLTEGLAVFLTPELAVRDDLTLREQVAALYQLKLETEFESLFAVDLWSFWSRSPARAYASAGAFLEALIETRAKTPKARHAFIRKLVKAGELYPVWSDEDERTEFVKSFTQGLTAQSLPPDALASAARRFAKPSAAFAQCGLREQKRDHELKALAMQGDFTKAELLLKTLKEGQAERLSGIARIAKDAGQYVLASSYLQRAIRLPNLKDARQKGELLEQLGDLLWLQNKMDSALQRYQEIEAAWLPLAAQRQLIAKMAFTNALVLRPDRPTFVRAAWRLLEANPEDELAISALQSNLAYDLGTYKSANLQEDAAEAIANYMYARRQIVGLNPDEGLKQLQESFQTAALPLIFQREAQKLVAKAYLIRQEPAKALIELEALKGSATRAAERLELDDRIERCQRALKGDKWVTGKELIYHHVEPNRQSVYYQ